MDNAKPETTPVAIPSSDADALEAFKDWTKAHSAKWNRAPMILNGEFKCFMDPETDLAWLGFEAAWNRRALPAARAEVSVAEAARAMLEGCPNPIFDRLKPVLMGEVKETHTYTDEDGEERYFDRHVSWDAMKEIIALALRALTEAGQ